MIDNDFEATSNRTTRGNGVVIHRRGNRRIKLAGTPNLDLSVPTPDDHAGVVIYADRGQAGVNHEITGNVDARIDGTLDAPTGKIAYTGNSRAAIAMLIADTIAFNGNSSFQCRAQLTDLPIPGGVARLGAATRVVRVP